MKQNPETIPFPDIPKPTLKRRQPLSPELEQSIIMLELAEAADDPHWLELALVILEDNPWTTSGSEKKYAGR